MGFRDTRGRIINLSYFLFSCFRIPAYMGLGGGVCVCVCVKSFIVFDCV